MIRIGLGLLLLASSFGELSRPIEQTQQAAPRPDLGGTWQPAEPARSNVLFNNGLGWVPGNGRIVIEQRPTRLTLTKYVPDDILEPLLSIRGQFNQAVIYRIVEPRGRSGGTGAGGDAGSSWQGDRLVLTQSRSGSRLISVSLSLEAARLKVETHTVIAGEGKQSTMTEWFSREK